jgi:hypothetical protein
MRNQRINVAIVMAVAGMAVVGLYLATQGRHDEGPSPRTASVAGRKPFVPPAEAIPNDRIEVAMSRKSFDESPYSPPKAEESIEAVAKFDLRKHSLFFDDLANASGRSLTEFQKVIRNSKEADEFLKAVESELLKLQGCRNAASDIAIDLAESKVEKGIDCQPTEGGSPAPTETPMQVGDHFLTVSKVVDGVRRSFQVIVRTSDSPKLEVAENAVRLAELGLARAVDDHLRTVEARKTSNSKEE